MKINLPTETIAYPHDGNIGSIIINDCTLREGMQLAKKPLDFNQNIFFAEALEEVGIHQIQGGYPGCSENDFNFVKALRKRRYKPDIEVLVQISACDWKSQIEKAVDCEADIISLMHPSSDLILKNILNISREEMLQRSIEAICYAKSSGAKIIRFGPTDTTRTDFKFLIKLFKEVSICGVDRLSISDTAGLIFPSAIKNLVEEISKLSNVPIQIHCHNDYGLALANAIAAVEAGAQIIDVTVNGLGERAGNVSLDELVVCLMVFYGLNLNIEMDSIYDLSIKTERLFGVEIPHNKPILGKNVLSSR